MNAHKNQFIEFALRAQALKFGQFTLKSGRISPYFFNTAVFNDGKMLTQLGRFYAQTLLDSQIPFDHLFGPAYKGIPLATATALALYSMQKNPSLTFNRKEAKAHGEGGILMGAPLHGATVMIDDVISAGTAFREAQSLINATEGHLSGVIIALDRCEKGLHQQSAIAEIRQEGIPVASIIDLHDILAYLQQSNKTAEITAIEHYLSRYGL
ncbi:MAG: orotate phosphoribosyltransferase [Legionellaceae bacterium]|nr:orotate phosphoribosyltransferase [Legionellaceae bacterium]